MNIYYIFIALTFSSILFILAFRHIYIGIIFILLGIISIDTGLTNFIINVGPFSVYYFDIISFLLIVIFILRKNNINFNSLITVCIFIYVLYFIFFHLTMITQNIILFLNS
jgi:hypothetical protein